VPIRVLPQEVASKIAAGEVIERPESVVKELIENALDASGNRIHITIEKGGKKLIEVIDDGCGIPSQEVPLVLERHSTSKLSAIEDLFTLESLGFRGEALTSISAVSHMELITRTMDEDVATRLVIDGGHADALQPIGAPTGTTVRVRDLFYNLPARLKFLKTENTERRRIQSLVSRYALAYPDVSFELTIEGRRVLQTTGNGQRREVLANIFGLEIAKNMIALPDPIEGPIQVNGFVSPPSIHRGTRREITFFVQGRWIHDQSLSAAVIQAYHGLLMVGRYPMAVILLKMPSQYVDVNVHPAKAEVRFQDPQQVFTIVQRAIRGTLLGQTIEPPVHFESSWWQRDSVADQKVIDPAWEMDRNLTVDRVPEIIQTRLPHTKVPLLRPVGQVGATYLVAEGPDGLYLIDQHAAHERVLYEAMMEAHKEGKLESQQLLEAIRLEMTRGEASTLEENLDLLNSLGFEIEPFGREMYRVRAVPAVLANADPGKAVMVVVENLAENESPLEREIESRVIARVCKQAAVKAGQILSLEEQRKLIQDLEACEVPRTCPHGRPTMIHLSVDTLEKQFGRRG
jgi:DNA mismatch repair protein MutL